MVELISQSVIFRGKSNIAFNFRISPKTERAERRNLGRGEGLARIPVPDFSRSLIGIDFFLIVENGNKYVGGYLILEK